MAKFYVGQRVRIKWSRRWPELVGEVGVIIGRPHRDEIPQGTRCEWNVAPECWGTNCAPDGGLFCPNGGSIEPLQPERNQAIAWSECIWRPEHMRAEA